MARMGRPPKQIDKREFEKLCQLQCTELEVCDWFDVTDVTLNNWCRETYGKTFSEVFRVKRGKGQISLRRKQWKLAEKSASMAIFLGKNFLGQTDKVEQTITGDNSPRVLNVNFVAPKDDDNASEHPEGV